MTVNMWLWIGFNALVLVMLALDLGVFHRTAHAVSLKEAVGWSAVWITLAMSFGALIWLTMGQAPALEYLAGYLIEKALSIDNIFIFVLIFGYFRVPREHQHRVLFWGVLGALLMRAGMIAVGATLIARFHWIIYLFGAFLLFTGIRMALQKHEADDPRNNIVVRLFRRLMPVADDYNGHSFFIRRNGRWWATPLLLVLALVETSDLIFAADSIPAVFAVTTDSFLIYTSNVFAILGLRSLYFLLAGVIGLFRYLKLGLAAILSFVGGKMLIAEFYAIPIALSLGIIAAILAASIIASVLIPVRGGQSHN